MIIGIGHTLRVGKDTAANALVRDLGFKRVAFADTLKDFVLMVDSLVMPSGGSLTVNTSAGRGRIAYMVHSMGWEQAKDNWPEIRRILQETGLAARKTFGENCWIEALEYTMVPGVNYVIPDVRFENEADWVRDIGGKVIKITRPGHYGQGHVSETALSKFEFDDVIENDSSVLELERKVVDLVKGYMNGAQSADPPPG